MICIAVAVLIIAILGAGATTFGAVTLFIERELLGGVFVSLVALAFISSAVLSTIGLIQVAGGG